MPPFDESATDARCHLGERGDTTQLCEPDQCGWTLTVAGFEEPSPAVTEGPEACIRVGTAAAAEEVRACIHVDGEELRSQRTSNVNPVLEKQRFRRSSAKSRSQFDELNVLERVFDDIMMFGDQDDEGLYYYNKTNDELLNEEEFLEYVEVFSQWVAELRWLCSCIPISWINAVMWKSQWSRCVRNGRV